MHPPIATVQCEVEERLDPDHDFRKVDPVTSAGVQAVYRRILFTSGRYRQGGTDHRPRQIVDHRARSDLAETSHDDQRAVVTIAVALPCLRQPIAANGATAGHKSLQTQTVFCCLSFLLIVGNELTVICAHTTTSSVARAIYDRSRFYFYSALLSVLWHRRMAQWHKGSCRNESWSGLF